MRLAVPLIYVLAVVITAVWIQRKRPAWYLGFTLAIWFVTPEVRRVFDWLSGRNAFNPMMLAPLIASSLVAPTVVRRFRSAARSQRIAVALIGGAMAIAFPVGAAKIGIAAATFDLFSWCVPILFGLYLLLEVEQRERHREVLQQTFLCSMLALGAYGMIQFFALPPWDRDWMWKSGMLSIGYPAPFHVRVFSMLNSPGPLAAVLMVGLPILLTVRSPYRWPAAALGYGSFALGLVRAAWGGWGLATAALIAASPRGQRLRIAATLCLMCASAIPLLEIGPHTVPNAIARVKQLLPATASAAPRPSASADAATRTAASVEQLTSAPVPPPPITTAGLASLQERVSQLSNLSQDNSLRERVAFFRKTLARIWHAPLGYGLGSAGLAAKLARDERVREDVNFDNGVLSLPFVLGWGGALLFSGGMLLLLLDLRRRRFDDLFDLTALATALALLSQMVFANVLTGSTGMLVWTLLAFALTAPTKRGVAT